MLKRVLLASLIVVAPALAIADSAEAKKHLDAAATAYKDKRWQDALDELTKANELDPKPELLFSIGQVYAKMEKCAEAITSYEKFLATNPAKDNVDMAQEAIDACKAKLPPPEPVKEPEPQPQPQPPPEEPKPPPPPPPAADRWYQDKLGVGLVGGGAAAILVGATFFVLANGASSDAADAATYGEGDDLYNSAKTKQTVGVVFTLAGAAAVGVGVYHYMRKKKSAEQRGISLVPTRDGGFVTWTWNR